MQLCSPDLLPNTNQSCLWRNVLHSSVQVQFQRWPDIFYFVVVWALWRLRNSWQCVFLSRCIMKWGIVHWTVVVLEDPGPLWENPSQWLATSFALESPHTLLSLCCLLLQCVSQHNGRNSLPRYGMHLNVRDGGHIDFKKSSFLHTCTFLSFLTTTRGSSQRKTTTKNAFYQFVLTVKCI